MYCRPENVVKVLRVIFLDLLHADRVEVADADVRKGLDLAAFDLSNDDVMLHEGLEEEDRHPGCEGDTTHQRQQPQNTLKIGRASCRERV